MKWRNVAMEIVKAVLAVLLASLVDHNAAALPYGAAAAGQALLGK